MLWNLQPSCRIMYFVPILSTHIQWRISGQRENCQQSAFHGMWWSLFPTSLPILEIHQLILDLLNYLIYLGHNEWTVTWLWAICNELGVFFAFSPNADQSLLIVHDYFVTQGDHSCHTPSQEKCTHKYLKELAGNHLTRYPAACIILFHVIHMK